MKKLPRPTLVTLVPIDLQTERTLPFWDKKSPPRGGAHVAGKRYRATDTAHYLQERVKKDVGRATVYRYASSRLPLRRSGPRLLLPTVYVAGQLHSSRRAIDDFISRMNEGA